jgi:hypothetical protein
MQKGARVEFEFQNEAARARTREISELPKPQKDRIGMQKGGNTSEGTDKSQNRVQALRESQEERSEQIKEKRIILVLPAALLSSGRGSSQGVSGESMAEVGKP